MDWQYEVSAGTKKQFGILKKLMAREDVASLVCATDAGREGELIFRLVYHKAGCRKPFERLWISSMEDVAIKEGFENLRSGTEYDALYEAALCRERADWIVGINATDILNSIDATYLDYVSTWGDGNGKKKSVNQKVELSLQEAYKIVRPPYLFIE